VASIARLGRVAAEAPRRRGLCFQRVARHEVTAMHEGAFELFRHAHFGGKGLRHVVTSLAIPLGMAGLAQALLRAGQRSVASHESAVMLQKSAGSRSAQILRRMARRALRVLPLLFVLMAGEAPAHGRQRRLPGPDDPAVALDALPADFWHGQMAGVLERDSAVGALGCSRERRESSFGIVVVTAAAKLRRRQFVLAAGLRRRMTDVAGQARLLSRLSAR